MFTLFKDPQLDQKLESPLEGVVTQFSTLFRKRQESRIKLLSNVFFVSNDYVGYWDIPYSIRTQHKKAMQTYFGKYAHVRPIHLFVAESDFLSWLTEEIPGDLLIMDIDQTLLNYLDRIILFIKKEYRDYIEHRKTYDHVKANILDVLQLPDAEDEEKEDKNVKERMAILGPHAWLANEENYVKCMESLLKRKVHTLNINLFEDQEVDHLNFLLRKKHYRVVYVNLTNLPDYDAENKLVRFLKILPFPDQDARLFLWNIHDRGVDFSSYDHYLWYANTVEVYEACFDQIMPTYWALKDFIDLSVKYPDADSFRRKLSSSQSQSKNRVHHISSNTLCLAYYAKLDTFLSQLQHVRTEHEQAKLPFGIWEMETFLEESTDPFNSKLFLHVDQHHINIIRNISILSAKYYIVFMPGIFEVLKIDQNFAQSVLDSLSEEKVNGMNVESAFINALMVLLMRDGIEVISMRQRLIEILRGYVSEVYLNHLNNTIKNFKFVPALLWSKNSTPLLKVVRNSSDMKIESRFVSFKAPVISEAAAPIKRRCYCSIL